MAATCGGFLIALVASAIWAKRERTHQPLKIALLIGVVCFLLSITVGVNVHGPGAILIFLALFSVLNFMVLLIVTYW
jgi:hypothetical protein